MAIPSSAFGPGAALPEEEQKLCRFLLLLENQHLVWETLARQRIGVSALRQIPAEVGVKPRDIGLLGDFDDGVSPV
jgi:hypothetical protein